MTSMALPGTRDKLLILLFASLLAAFALVSAAPAAAQAPGSSGDGTRSLFVSKATGVAIEGETVTVSGSGYDIEKGIYVAFCVIPPAGQLPSPCGGGADASGASGVSVWISSNAPDYAASLAQPYGPGGTFTVTLNIRAMLNDSTDCRAVRCAVVTRNDHTRGTDRSQDVFVPITFGAPAPTPTATATPPPATTTATAPPATASATSPATAPPSATPTPSPTDTASPTPTATITASATATATSTRLPSTLSQDARTVSAGAMTLTASKTTSIAPGDTVTVTGRGFDTSTGIFVALCKVPTDRVNAPAPCAGGSTTTSAWVSSNPPDYGKDRAKPFGDGGSFEVTLEFDPVIDAKTDCRQVACAITTRSDDTAAKVRSSDMVLPVSFAAAGAATPGNGDTATDDTATTSDDGGGSSAAGWLIAGAVIVLIAIAGAAFALLRGRGRGTMAGSLLALAAIVLTGCSDSGGGHTGAPSEPIVVGDENVVSSLPVTVTSADGREVTITDTSRIVPLWGNITEVVYGLGLGSHVVARDVSATFPEAAALPTVTRGHDVSAEGVLSLKPTLVLASADNSGPSSALDQIRSVGIPVVVFEDPASVEDIVPRIRAIAKALGVPEAGEALVQRTEAELATARDGIPANAGSPRVAFLYMRGQAGVYLIGGPGSGADSMIRAAGATDAGTAMGLSDPFTPITSEALAKAAPDIILMTSSGLESVGGVDGLVKIPGIAQTPAGKDRRIVTVEDGLLYSFGPRTPAALETLIELLYPSQATVRTP